MFTPEEIEQFKAQDINIIKQGIIEIQTLAAALKDKIDAFGKDYKDSVNDARIYIWATGIDYATSKVKKIAKESLVSDGQPKSISVDMYNLDVDFTGGGTSLDTLKLKKFDPVAYMSLAKHYPKVSKPRASIKVSEKKGVI